MNLKSKDLPTNETKKSNEGSNEPSLQLPIHGEAVSPAPSTCDVPSRVALSACDDPSGVILSACDAPSGDAPSTFSIITVDNPPQVQ